MNGNKLQATTKEYEKAKNFKFKDYEDVKKVMYLAYCPNVCPKKEESFL